MSRFHGPQPGYKGLHGRTKGVMLAYRELQRGEAENRANERRASLAKQARDNSEAEARAAETSA